MKKSILTLSAIALVAMGISSCQKEETATPQMIKHFRAGIENSTKTTLNDDLYTEWVAFDQVRLSMLTDGGSTYGAFLSATPDQDDPTWADFETDGELEIVGGIRDYEPFQFLYAVYPASIAQGQRADRVCLPAEQNSTNGNLVGAPMVADFRNVVLEGDALPRVKFQNLCGVMKIHLQQENTSISEIAVIADQQLRGTYTISYTDGTPALTPVAQSNANCVTLALDGAQDIGSEGKDFYIYLPAGNYTNMMLRFKNSAGNYATKTCAAVTINRNEIVPITIGGNIEFPAQLRERAFSNISGAISITFHYNSAVTDGENIAVAGTTPAIYMVNNNGIVDIYTAASTIEAPASCNGLFRNFRNLQTIDFGNGFSTTNVTNMCEMFINCGSLRSLDLSSFNTARVQTMRGMFNTCRSLTAINVSNFNTANVTDMSYMFKQCHVQQLDLSSFSSSSNPQMNWMFYDCEYLSSIEFNQYFTVNTSSYLDRTCSFVPSSCTIHCNNDFATALRQYGSASSLTFNTTY